MTDVIAMENLEKDYVLDSGVAVPVLKGIDLFIEPGEYVAIMGPSGSGKSTLMNILGTLDRPSRGMYLLDGEDIGGLDDKAVSRLRNNTIGFVFQGFNLLPRRKLLDNIALPLFYGGEKRAERRERAAYYLEQVGLAKYCDHLPGQLSGGQQQRVAIARALAGEPKLIVADEPTGSLDSNTTKEIMEIFAALHRKRRESMTIVMVTHEEDVARYAERLVQIKDGEIVYDGPMF
jgi:putative ABC transport system ATP-binding protein